VEPWLLALEYPLVALAIPVTVLIGYLWRRDTLIAVAGAAWLPFLALGIIGIRGTVASAVLASAGVGQLKPSMMMDLFIVIYVFVGGIVLMIAGWTLALANALRGRHWFWLIALTPCAYLTLVLFFYISYASSYFCLFASANQLLCPGGPALADTLYLAACVVGPGSILAYALWARVGLSTHQQSRALPDGVSVTSLNTSQGADETN
jgi:hypothetical protein